MVVVTISDKTLANRTIISTGKTSYIHVTQYRTSYD